MLRVFKTHFLKKIVCICSVKEHNWIYHHQVVHYIGSICTKYKSVQSCVQEMAHDLGTLYTV